MRRPRRDQHALLVQEGLVETRLSILHGRVPFRLEARVAVDGFKVESVLPSTEVSLFIFFYLHGASRQSNGDLLVNRDGLRKAY